MEEVVQPLISTPGLVAIAAALSVGLGALATGWSQSAIGSSAIGAVTERPELGGNVLIWMAIPETLALFGLVVAIILALNIGNYY